MGSWFLGKPESLKDSIHENLYNQYNKSLKIFYHKKSLKLYKQYNKNYKTYNKGLSNSILIQEKLKVLLFDKENLQCLKSEFKELHKQYGTKSQTLQTEKKFHTWLTKSRVWASALKTVLANSLKEGLREKGWLVQRVLREERNSPWLLFSMGSPASIISKDLALRSFKSFAPRNHINCSRVRPIEAKASKFNALPIEIGDITTFLLQPWLISLRVSCQAMYIQSSIFL